MNAPQRDNRLNFSGGPGVLPELVLDQLQESIRAVPEVGLSVLGISHRSDWFAQVVRELEDNVRQLLGLDGAYRVLFLQGGATQQFSMVPMTWLRGSPVAADYLHTGYWSGKSLPEARREGPVHLLWSGEAEGFRRLPEDGELAYNPAAPYFHYVSNETVEGLQFRRVLGLEAVPRVCDMSSDFLSRPCEAERFALIYAHAQKNIGPAGVTVVVLREDFLGDRAGTLPPFLDYRAQIDAHSIYNTPPVFAIYAVLLVTRWLKDTVGGLAAMDALNREKADLFYGVLDDSDGFYRGHVRPEDRSLMNVAFTLGSPEGDRAFLAAAEAAGFSGLGGHRSLGGLRASLYNGLTREAVARLAQFMTDYRHQARA